MSCAGLALDPVSGVAVSAMRPSSSAPPVATSQGSTADSGGAAGATGGGAVKRPAAVCTMFRLDKSGTNAARVAATPLGAASSSRPARWAAPLQSTSRLQTDHSRPFYSDPRAFELECSCLALMTGYRTSQAFMRPEVWSATSSSSGAPVTRQLVAAADDDSNQVRTNCSHSCVV